MYCEKKSSSNQKLSGMKTNNFSVHSAFAQKVLKSSCSNKKSKPPFVGSSPTVIGNYYVAKLVKAAVQNANSDHI